MIMEEARYHARYGRARESWWSSKRVYRRNPITTCPTISRWVFLRSKRSLSSPVCRTLLLAFTLMILTTAVFNPSSPSIDTDVVDKIEMIRHVSGVNTPIVAIRTLSPINRTSSSSPTNRTSRSSPTNKTRLHEGDEWLVQTTNQTSQEKSKHTESLSLSPASVFARKYAPPYTQNDAEFFSFLSTISKQKWKYNAINAKTFRADLQDALGKDGRFENFVATRQNMQPGQNISFYFQGSRKLSKTLWKHLSKGSLHKRRRHQRCSVVGSSGVLNGSRCGNLIDKATFVIRFNLAYVKGYETDVGSKTHFTTLNPSLVFKRFAGLKSKQNYSVFANILKQFKGSLLWLPGFASTRTHRTMVRVAKAAVFSKLVTPAFGHPDHYTAVANLWQTTLNTTGWTTTGLHALTSFFSLCDHIDVFGFWPFAKSLENREIPYHYHDDRNGSSNHSFTKEFRALLHLHQLGIINLHLGSCR